MSCHARDSPAWVGPRASIPGPDDAIPIPRAKNISNFLAISLDIPVTV